MEKERKFWEILAESQHDKLVLSWLSVVLTVLVIVLEFPGTVYKQLILLKNPPY